MENSSNKTLWIAVIIIVVGLLAWWFLAPKKAVSPVVNENTASIGDQLQGLNDADMNAELNDVTQDVSKL